MTCFLIEVQKSKVRKGWARGGDEGEMGWWISSSNDYGYNKTLGLQILAAAWILIYSKTERWETKSLMRLRLDLKVCRKKAERGRSNRNTWQFDD